MRNTKYMPKNITRKKEEQKVGGWKWRLLSNSLVAVGHGG